MLTGHVVRSDGAPIPHVLVSLFGTGDSAETRDDGGFVLHPPRAGAYMVGARGLGLREKRFAMTFAAGASRDVTITMVPFVPMLPRVVTTAEERAAYASVGFDQRRRMGVGQFLTYDQILNKHPNSFTQLLQGMRGVSLSQGPLQSHSPGTGVSGTEGMGSCMSYVVDGIPQEQLMGQVEGTADKAAESPDNLIDVTQVAALEVYSAAERPPGYGGMEQQAPPPPETRTESTNPTTNAGNTQMVTPGNQNTSSYMPQQPCGLVMVWTRGRLGLTESNGDAAPVVPQKTAPHDMTLGVASLARGAGCNPPPAADTMDLLVYASVQGPSPRAMSDSAWSTYKNQVLAALTHWSDLPSEVSLPSFGLPGARGAARGIPPGGKRTQLDVIPVLSTVLSFTLDSAGALGDVHVAASSLAGGVDTSAIAMIEQAAAAHGFPHLSGQAVTDTVQLYLVVEAAEPGPGGQAAVLGQLEVPAWRLSRTARLQASSKRSDRRPGSDRGAPGDSLTVTMVVDSTGQVAKGTAMFEVAEQAGGSAAGVSERDLLQMLPALRFDPATIGSCRVNTLVTQSFATADVLTPPSP